MITAETRALLHDYEAAYRDAYARSDGLRTFRNAEIRRAIEAGGTHAEVAEATGLSRARVGQLAPKR